MRSQEDDARRQESGDGDVDWRECGASRAHVASSGSTGHVGQAIGSGHGSGCDANARRSAGSEYSIASRRSEDERCGEGVAGVSIRGARALLGKLWRPPGKAEGFLGLRPRADGLHITAEPCICLCEHAFACFVSLISAGADFLSTLLQPSPRLRRD